MPLKHRHSNRLRPLVLAAYALGLTLYACADANASAGVVNADQELRSQFDPERLRHGKPQPLVEGITSIENQLFTKSGRLFVTGDDGIFEILRASGSDYHAQSVHGAERCAFGGLTEYRDTLYANCYDLTNGDSSVFASALGGTLDFRAIHRLPGVALANGLTSDGNGNLFVASTVDGKIIRLRVKDGDPLTIIAQEDWNAQSGLFTNGLKYFDSALYWTAFTTLFSAPIKPDGKAGPTRTLTSAATFFDDLHIDGNGIWLDDYLNGTVVACELNGRVQAATPNGTFDGPSSVQPALGRLGLPPDAFVVTEKNANRLSLYVQ